MKRYFASVYAVFVVMTILTTTVASAQKVPLPGVNKGGMPVAGALIRRLHGKGKFQSKLALRHSVLRFLRDRPTACPTLTVLPDLTISNRGRNTSKWCRMMLRRSRHSLRRILVCKARGRCRAAIAAGQRKIVAQT